MICISTTILQVRFRGILRGVVSIAVLATLVLAPAMELAAEVLAAPRLGVVQNVPLAAPWNGCLLVRDGPNTNSKILGHVINGTTVRIEATEGAWYKISSPMTGYVYGTYVKITEADTPPVNPSNQTQALTLEEIVIKADPSPREKRLEERRKFLEDNDTSPPPQLPSRP